MPKAEGASRVTRRASTKSATRKACQNATKGIIPRERRRFANAKVVVDERESVQRVVFYQRTLEDYTTE